MEPVAFVKRLAATPFEGDLQVLVKAEEDFRSLMGQYKGYGALSDAFMRLFLETVVSFNNDIQPRVSQPVSAQHAFLVETLARAFQSLRAAQVTAHSGYPMQAFTQLRNIYDDCVLTAAVMHGLTNFEELAGIKPGEDFEEGRARKNRIATERRVRPKMNGADSGLSAETRKWLCTLDKMYDWETHGSRLSTAHNASWLKGAAPLPIVPRFKEEVVSIFLNRYLEVAWLVHRLLPLIQLPGHALSIGWSDRWRVVDESFHHVVMSLFKDLQKPVFAAVCDFVEKKFAFNAASRFPL